MMVDTKSQTIEKKTRAELLLPWKFVLFYFVGCFVLYLIGPWKYAYAADWKIFVFVISFCVFSFIGYGLGVNSYLRKTNLQNVTDRSISIKFLNIVIFVSFVSALLMVVIKIRECGVPISGNIFATMAQAYSALRSRPLQVDQAMRVFYRTAFFFYFAIPVGLYEYKRLHIFYKVLLICSIGLLSVYTVLYSGQQKQIGDLVVLIFSVILINYKPTRLSSLSKKKLLLGILLVVLVFLFSAILAGRAGMMNKTASSVLSQAYTLNDQSFIFKIFPAGLALGFSYFLFYLSNGFQGLNVCLQQPFVWTKGLGSTGILVVLLEQYTKFDLGNTNILTYPYRAQLATGWSATSTWHTIFPWLASDFTYVGAIVILSIGAYMYGKCWCEIRYQRKWQSVFLFSVLNIQWIYMVANNQLFNSKSTFVVFMIALLLWFTRNIRVKR